MIRRTLVVAAALFVLGPTAAFGSFYGGAAIGNSWYNHDPEIQDIEEISENSTGWKIFGGFAGKSLFALEGGYRDFGTVEVDGLNGAKFESGTTGWDVAGMLRLKVAILDIFGKAGAFFWSTEGEAMDESGTAFLWGLGAGVRLGPVGVRLEWESVEVDNPNNLSMLSLGATLGF